MQVSSCDLFMQVCGKQFIHVPYDGSGQNVCQLSKYIHEMTFDAMKGLIFINVMLLELQLLDVSSESSDQEQKGTHCIYSSRLLDYVERVYTNGTELNKLKCLPTCASTCFIDHMQSDGTLAYKA